MRPVERPSRSCTLLNEIESMIMSFCSQELRSTPKKETIRISFCNHRVTTPPRQQKYRKRAGMCINESDRLPYFNSYLLTSPAQRIRNENDQEMFLTNVISYLCAHYGAMHRSVSQRVIGLSLE